MSTGVGIDIIKRVPVPAKKYRWRVHLPLWGWSEMQFPSLALSAVKVVIPGLSIDVEERVMGNTKEHFAGLCTIDSAKITFRETEDGQVYQYIHKWIRYIYASLSSEEMGMRVIEKKRGLAMFADDYKKTIGVEMLDGEGRGMWGFILKGAFPKTPGAFDLDYTQKDQAVEVDVDFSVDSVELDRVRI